MVEGPPVEIPIAMARISLDGRFAGQIPSAAQLLEAAMLPSDGDAWNARRRRRADLGNQLLGNGVQIRGDRAVRLADEIKGSQLQAFEGFYRALLGQRTQHDYGADLFRQDHLHGADAIELRHVDVHGHDIGFQLHCLSGLRLRRLLRSPLPQCQAPCPGAG